MKHLAFTLSIAVLLGTFGAGASAATELTTASLTCDDFAAMSADEQRAALDTLHSEDRSEIDTEVTTDTETDLSADSDLDTDDADTGADLWGETDTDVGASIDMTKSDTSASNTYVCIWHDRCRSESGR